MSSSRLLRFAAQSGKLHELLPSAPAAEAATCVCSVLLQEAHDVHVAVDRRQMIGRPTVHVRVSAVLDEEPHHVHVTIRRGQPKRIVAIRVDVSAVLEEELQNLGCVLL